MGYIEETGAAQYLRDARIATIYEGTTGIQAGDLVGRKLARDGGAAFAAFAADIHAELASYRGTATAAEPVVATADAALVRLEETVGKLLADLSANPAAAAAVAVPLLRLAGITFGGWLQARAANRGKHPGVARRRRPPVPTGEDPGSPVLCRAYSAPDGGPRDDRSRRRRQRARRRPGAAIKHYRILPSAAS